MTRLSSYSVYILVFIIPAAVIGIIVSVITDRSNSSPVFYAIFLLPLSVWAYIIYQSKRIYYDGTDLYLYNLFSGKAEVVKKDQAATIEKRNLSFWRDTGTYKLTYWASSDRVKSVWFSMNNFLDNPDEIIEQINSVY